MTNLLIVFQSYERFQSYSKLDLWVYTVHKLVKLLFTAKFVQSLEKQARIEQLRNQVARKTERRTERATAGKTN